MKNFNQAILATITATSEDEAESYIRQLLCAAHASVSNDGAEICTVLKQLDKESEYNLRHDPRLGRKFDEIQARDGTAAPSKTPAEMLVTQLNNINFANSWRENAARLRATLDIIQSWTGVVEHGKLIAAMERVKNFLKESKKVETSAKQLLLEKIGTTITHVEKTLVPA